MWEYNQMGWYLVRVSGERERERERELLLTKIKNVGVVQEGSLTLATEEKGRVFID
jgi:hypothetical protein